LQLLSHNLNKTSRRIAVPINTGIEIVRLEDILYFQAEGSYTKIFQENMPPILVSKNLKSFEEQVTGEINFFRCHRSFLVNTTFIKKVLKSDGGLLQLTTGETLPITNERIETLIDILAS
jgi:two-component system LytT family response regulator